MGRWLGCLLVAFVAPGGFAAEVPTHVTVLQYHHVSVTTPASTSLSPERFAEHLQWLADNDFAVVALPDALRQFQAGEAMRDRTAVITFDDGYRSIYDAAFPILREFDYPFTIFVNPEPHDAGRPAWVSWDELREMADVGATIANHTQSHAYLIRREGGESDEEWRARIRAEIETAEQRIAAKTGQSHRILAYPYGESNAVVRALVQKLGYTAFGQQSGPVGAGSDETNLPRFPLSGSYAAMETFRTKMRSLPLAVTAARPETRSGDEILMFNETRPALEIELADAGGAPLNCFASGQGAIPVERLAANRVRIRAPEPLGSGRSRYNCTQVSEWPGRYYWYSYTWVLAPPGQPTVDP